ncbi:hypothetical protein Syun_007403 [Stephania yunnanensis]|uniref:Uncharacterized protein n=1 Tax=Stephania yunnanensis TaxID=152371 RepID=A0AAP0PYH4_9MAGN
MSVCERCIKGKERGGKVADKETATESRMRRANGRVADEASTDGVADEKAVESRIKRGGGVADKERRRIAVEEKRCERRSGDGVGVRASGRCERKERAMESRRTMMMEVADDGNGGGDSAGDDNAKGGEGGLVGWFAQRRDEEDGF